MIILDTTNKTLEVILNGAVTANELPFTAHYVDITATSVTAGQQDGATNGTTAVTVLSAPAASTQRQLKFFSLYNSDTAPATVTIRYNNNGTTRIVYKIILNVGYSLLCDVNGKFYIFPDGTGSWVGDTHSTLTYAATTDIDMSHVDNYRTISLTGNITFTTSNKALMRSKTIRIISDASARTFTFPASWKWLGTTPTGIAASKTAILTLLCYGTAETDVLASYNVQV